MSIDHTVPAYTDRAAPFIEEDGGKLGGIEFIRAYSPKLRDRVLPMVIVPPDKEWNGKVPARCSKYIIRPSDRGDFQGLVDALPTRVTPDCTSIKKLAKIINELIEKIRRLVLSPQVMGYGQYENPAFDGKVVIGIQEFRCGQSANIAKHPNRPGCYIASFTNNNPMLTLPSTIYSCLYDENTGREEILYRAEKNAIPVSEMVEIYREIERIGLVKDNYSFQVEFKEDYLGQGPAFVAQVRALMPFEKASFKLDGGHDGLVIGVTPPKGIEVPLIHSPDGLDRQKKPVNCDAPWALIKTKHDESAPLDFRPKNLAAYLISRSFREGLSTNLGHGHFRFVQKAGVTIFEPSPSSFNPLFGLRLPLSSATSHLRRCAGKLGVIRIIADGVRSIVEAV